MVHIVACIKQVPLSDDVDFDEAGGRMRRHGRNVINAFDLRAIAMAVHIAGQLVETRTTVVTMGPPQAADALREALAMGMDEAVHLVDPVLAGADTLATARALAAWLQRAHADLVLLGKYSLDAETAQVGPELAELLGVAQVTGARALRIDGRTLHAERETDAGVDEVECELPALVTCAERLIKPVKIGDGERSGSAGKTLRTVTAAELGDIAGLGLGGSPTRVGAARRVAHTRKAGRLIRATPPAQAALEAVDELQRLGCSWSPTAAPVPPRGHVPRRSRANRDVWIACESTDAGEVTETSLELVSRGTALADAIGGELAAIVTASDRIEAQVRTLSEHGADHVMVIDLEPERAYSADTMAAALAPLVEKHSPAMLLTPATERGRDWTPRLAARLGLGMTGDAIDLSLGADADLIAHKPAFGGSLVAEIHCRTRPHLATVRPGILGRPRRVVRSDGAAVTRHRPVESVPLLRRVRSQVLVDEQMTPIGRATTVVGVGMGIGGPEGVAVAAALARTLDAALCGTRPVCDRGWLPRQLQVGLTGKGLNAELYIALGVSGSPNHTIALKGVNRILAVNSNPDAAIFDLADVGIVGPCIDVAKALADAFAGGIDSGPLSARA
jgi:electron transfer flavoprotein alpha subunit